MTAHVYGDSGFFYIPELDFSIPLYESNKKISGQAIVDRENSGVLSRHFGGGHCDYIADHASQGFDIIKKCKIGTVAVFQTKNKTIQYSCVAIMPGTNIKKNLITCCGQKLTNVNWADLVCYCCNDSAGVSITMVFFKKTVTCNYPLYEA